MGYLPHPFCREFFKNLVVMFSLFRLFCLICLDMRTGFGTTVSLRSRSHVCLGPHHDGNRPNGPGLRHHGNRRNSLRFAPQRRPQKVTGLHRHGNPKWPPASTVTAPPKLAPGHNNAGHSLQGNDRPEEEFRQPSFVYPANALSANILHSESITGTFRSDTAPRHFRSKGQERHRAYRV